MTNKFFLFVLGLMMISSVYALGVTPGRTTIDFKPGLQKEIGFEILNSEGDDVELELSFDGELRDYMDISSRKISISSAEPSKSLSYTVKLPENLEPGLRTGRLLITEVPEESSLGESYVAATLGVAIQLHVNVPFPGKYASSSMIIYNSAPGEEVTFVFPIVSKGEFDLSSVRANVDIYNKLDEKVGSFNTNSISVASGDKKELVHRWANDLPIGDYRAEATIIYDEGTLDLEGFFSIGSKEIELQEINVNDFTLGQIVKLEMLVENKWSEPISGAYIETRVMDDDGDVVASFDSATYDLEPLTKTVFTSYWDTSGVKIGNYQTEVSIKYGDKVSKKSLEFQVNENDLVIVGLGYVISSDTGSGEGSGGLVIILVVVIVVLVIINMLWFLLLRKKLKK